VTQELDPELVNAYEATLFTVQLPSGSVLFGVGQAPLGDIRSLGTRPLTVITAYNPGSERPDEAQNRAANERLRQTLIARGTQYHDAVGQSADRSHSEPSFAVPDLTEQQAHELGLEFDQACVFYWTGKLGKLLWCTEGEPP